MAQMQIGDAISFPAGADLSAAANLYKIVKMNSSQQVILASAATDKIIGVLQNLPKSGETASVMARCASGVGKVVAGGTIAIGDYLTSGASGTAVATTTAGDEVIGIATEAGVTGQVVSYLFANSRY